MSGVFPECKKPPTTLAGLGVLSAETIDTADHVKHGPSGEAWVVARATSSHVYPCGWPPSRGDLADCILIKKATPGERDQLLEALAAGTSENAAWAKSALAARGVRVDAPTVEVERDRVWIKRGVQSFMLAYDADTEEERQWYAQQLRSALGIAGVSGTPKASDGSQPE